MSERVIFHEEGRPGQHLRLIVNGVTDARLLDALDSYISRQRDRLKEAADALETEAFEWIGPSQ